jgi:hypothetical protein
LIGLLPAAAFAVHQLRFMLAFGGGAGAALHRSGHAYLHSLAPWLVALLALAAGWLLRALGRAFAGQRSLPRYVISLSALWLACSVALVAIFVTQEFLEGLFATGHPTGLAGIFGYGGWWAIPVAACIGLVLATVSHGALWVVEQIALRRATQLRHVRGRTTGQDRPPGALLPRLVPLAGGWSGRGPPR